MPIRSSPLSLYLRSRYDLNATYARLAQAQIEISSGRRIHVLSDDPADGARALDTRVSLLRTGQARDSVVAAQFSSERQAELLESISTIIADARATAVAAGNGVNSEAELKTFATELDGKLAELISIANTKLEGRYLFSGSKVNTPPILTKSSNGSVISVSYAGDDLTRTVRLGPYDTKPVDVSGLDAFFSLNRGPSSFAGPSGLAGKTNASDTMVGSEKIVVTHTATTIGDGVLPGGGDSVSGLAPGTSTADDTLLGSHTLSVTSDPLGAGSFISVDGGDPVAFDGTETDLQLTAPGGGVLHVDVTGLTPGYTGDVATQGDGEISVEGQPPVALTFQDDFVLEDGTGRVVHLDTTTLHREGVNVAVFPGTESVFDVMIGLRDDVTGGSGFPPESLASRIQARLTSLDRGHDSILGSMADLGSRSAAFQRIGESLSFFEVSLEERSGQLEGADVFKSSFDLAEAESAYQAALVAAGKLNNLPSLINYI